MKYKTEQEIDNVIEQFEAGTIDREAWGHPEHLIVAYRYSQGADFETAYQRMKAGIFNLLKAFEVDLTKAMPYHETMTVFWLRVVFSFANTPSDESLVERTHKMIKKFDKHYPGKFYSKELLLSNKARSEFVEPDLESFDS
jgi:hypothetical protein